jgi:hypothetical protein
MYDIIHITSLTDGWAAFWIPVVVTGERLKIRNKNTVKGRWRTLSLGDGYNSVVQ